MCVFFCHIALLLGQIEFLGYLENFLSFACPSDLTIILGLDFWVNRRGPSEMYIRIGSIQRMSCNYRARRLSTQPKWWDARCEKHFDFRLLRVFPLLLLYLYYFMLLDNNNPTCAQRRTALLQPLQHHNNNHGMGNLNKRYRCIIPITIKSFMQARKRGFFITHGSLWHWLFTFIWFDLCKSKSKSGVKKIHLKRVIIFRPSLHFKGEKNCMLRKRTSALLMSLFCLTNRSRPKSRHVSTKHLFFNPPLVKLFFLAKKEYAGQRV